MINSKIELAMVSINYEIRRISNMYLRVYMFHLLRFNMHVSL
jgi:hypothetical protein